VGCDAEEDAEGTGTVADVSFGTPIRKSRLGVRAKDGRNSFALWCDLAGIPRGWKRALMRHQAENVTQEYGWQESERIEPPTLPKERRAAP
jgi:uncharacterized protein YbdZ (MbtH family)